MAMSDAQLHAISRRLARIHAGEDPQCIARMASGWAILAKFQPEPIVGSCMLLPDPVVPSLEHLPHDRRVEFLTDFATLGEAVHAATSAERINYLILCNQVPELHGHCVPRFANEEPDRRSLDPFAAYDFGGARIADATGVDRELFGRLRAQLERLRGVESDRLP